NSIFLENRESSADNYASFVLNTGNVTIDDNWWGTTAQNHPETFGSNFVQGAEPNKWLFIKSDVSSDKIGYNETSTIKYVLYSHDGTEISEFDNSLLPNITFDVTSDNGGLDKNAVSLNEEFTYTAVNPGSANIYIHCNNMIYETYIKGPYMVPIVDVPFTMYANQPLNKKELIKTADDKYGSITLSINDSSLINLNSDVKDIRARTTEGTAKLTFTYEGSTIYDAETFEMVVRVLKVPIVLNVTNIESNEITLNVTDTLDIDIEGIVDSIHSGYATSGITVIAYKFESSIISFTYDYTGVTGDPSYYATGHITALTGGTTNLTICLADTNAEKFKCENYTIKITVNKIPTEVTAEDINPLKVDDESGVSADFYVNGTLNTETALTYESSDENVIRFTSGSNFKAVGNGTAVITVKFNGNSTHEASSKEITVTVNKYDSEITLTSDNATPKYLQTITITPSVGPDGATGTVTYYIGDNNISEALGLNVPFEFTVDRVGEFNITAKYSGDYKYSESKKNITITSSKADTTASVVVSKDKSYPEEVTVTVNSIIAGDYTIDINGTEVTVTIPDGETSATATHKFGADSYYANITGVPESDLYNINVENDTFSVAKGENNAVITIASENYLPGPVNVQVTGVKGTYVVRFNNGKEVTVVVDEDGQTGENTIELIAGDYEAEIISCDNDNYTTTADPVHFEVLKSQNIVVVTVDDVYLPGNVIVKVKANATGIYTVEFNDSEKTKVTVSITTPNGEGSNATAILKAGSYSANATFADNDNYTSTITNDTFEVKRSDIKLEIVVKSENGNQIVYGNNVTGYIKTNVSGTYTVKLANSEPFYITTDGVNNFEFNKSVPLDVGDYYAVISVDQQDDYNANSVEYLFKVVQTPTPFNPTSTKEEYTYGEEIILEIELPGDATGKVTFRYDGTNIGEIEDVTSTQTISLGVLDANSDYTIIANYSGDNNYQGIEKEISFKVNKANNYIEVFVDKETTYPNNVTIKVNATVAGTYQVNVSGTVYEIEANTSSISHKFDAGEYYANVTYSDKNYNGITANATFTVNKGINDIKVDVSSSTYPNNVTVRVMATVGGTYNVTVNKKTYEIEANGSGISIHLAAGSYEANLIDYERDNYIAQTENATFTVSKAIAVVVVSVENTTLPGNLTVKVVSNMPGNYKVTINDTSVDVAVGPDGNGNASIYLPAGKGYLANTSFADSENYTIFITPAVFDINKADNNIVVSVESVEYPDV
ncbi:Ig-like domain repeat protein, partial [Methanobrevibacter sp.]|uniref:Ig-like domain repeat protein n=1 Tax=Methanobrevibacter sp. TaxID=66852 RepID=UPI0026DF67C4